MREYATELTGNIESKYDWRRPDLSVTPRVVAKEYSYVKKILADSGVYKSGVTERLERLTRGVQLNIAPVSLSYSNHRLA